MTINNITPDEVLDSRDIIDRAQDLIEGYLPVHNEQMLTRYPESEPIEAEDALHDEPFLQWLKDNSENDEEAQELVALIGLWRECEDISDWSYGETLIRDDYFTDFARGMLEDCGEIPRDIPHYVAIDWEQTAENIQVDYTYVNFMENTYWIRNC